MRIVDFSRSFFTFRIDTLKKPPRTVTHKPPVTLNNARIQIDCRCAITDGRGGETREFLLGASCKTERVNVERDIWTEPNADFIPVLSPDHFLSIKTFDHAARKIALYPPELGEQPHRQLVRTEDAFDSVRLHVAWTDGTELKSVDEVLASIFANEPLVASTEFSNARYHARIDYPVKTINAGEREHFYQTDTGPVLLPDLACEPDHLLNGMDLAFAAFNCSDWTEFLVRDLAPVDNGFCVYHYCRPVRMDVKNRLYVPAAAGPAVSG